MLRRTTYGVVRNGMNETPKRSKLTNRKSANVELSACNKDDTGGLDVV